MDEPTAALSGVEVERLFAVARSLRDEGRALLFISHRFDEVFALCDIVTVMRDGSYIATTPIAETTVDELVRQMVGRDVAELFPKLPAEIGDDVLVVDGLTRAGVFHDISFTVRCRRDRRPGRARGRGSQRGRARDLRRRPLRGRVGAPRRSPAPEGQSAGLDGARARAGSRGPPQAGARARRERHAQRHPRHPLVAREGGAALERRRERVRPRSGRAASRSRPRRSTPRPAR